MRLFSDVDSGGERFDLVRMRQVSEREYVSREMALDAEEPQMEGSLYSDEKWESECVGQVWYDEQATRDAALGAAVHAVLAEWQKIDRVSVEELRRVAHDLHHLEGIDTCGFASAVLEAVAEVVADAGEASRG
jgi:hypothetical protein